jgi:hypothetical protein
MNAYTYRVILSRSTEQMQEDLDELGEEGFEVVSHSIAVQQGEPPALSVILRRLTPPAAGGFQQVKVG